MRTLRHLPVALVAVLALATGTACGDGGGTPGNTIAVTAKPPVPDAPLTATEWTVNALISGGTVSPVPAAAAGKAVFTIAADGTASGSLGCNRFSAKAAVDGPEVTFGPLTTTRMACPGPPGELERALTELLGSGPLTWMIQAQALTLTAPDGKGLTARAASGGARRG